jgi:predicted hotdog family 3-hydroxylacyl-ACP dehydratase
VLISREAIGGMIPHAGAMHLLDGVLSWDSGRIVCRSSTHCDPANPLRINGRLPALCGIEYAAQAMAVHGSLAGNLDHRPKAGYLASVRKVRCSGHLLDEFPGDLMVEAERLDGEASHVIYRFWVRAGDVELLQGRATVVLDTDRTAP